MNSNVERSIIETIAQLSLTTILDLNNDCLLKIFRYLDFTDLAMVWDASRHFQEPASDAFKLEWSSKTIWLRNDNKMPSMAVLRHFGSQFKKILVDCGERKNDLFFEKIIENCRRSQLMEVHFSRIIVSKESMHRFANKFTNLRYIGIENVINNRDQLDCFDLHFPKLEELKLYAFPFDNRSVEQFVRYNPQLKCLALLYHNDVANVSNLLKSVDQHLKQLEGLEVSCTPGIAQEFELEPKLFKNLKQLTFRGFDSETTMRHLLISIDNVETLDFVADYLDTGLIDFICNYRKVKHLSIRYIDYPLNYGDLLKLNEHLPKLETIEIASFTSNANHLAIVNFVLTCKQLRQLVIRDAELQNVLEFAKHVQNELGSTKWRVRCSPVNGKLIVRKLSK